MRRPPRPRPAGCLGLPPTGATRTCDRVPGPSDRTAKARHVARSGRRTRMKPERFLSLLRSRFTDPVT